VLVAGVTFNALFAWAIFTLILMVGVKAPVGDFPEKYSGTPSVMVTGLSVDGPAAQAGLQTGDEIIAVSGQTSTSTLLTSDVVKSSIVNSTSTLGFLIKRKGELKNITMVPVDGVTGVAVGKKGIGVLMSDVVTVRMTIIPAISAGFTQTVNMTKLIVVGTYDFLGRAITGHAKLSEVSGPVGIAGHVGEAAKLGFVYLANFAAFISLNLAVLNLLPIPALDGGRLVFVIIESIIRRPLSQKVLQVANSVSFALLILLMLYVTWHDVFVLIK
jgi:regulator of sigma E protease